MTDHPASTLGDLIRGRVLDAQLGALLSVLAEGGLAVHVAGPDATAGARFASAIGPRVTVGGGSALEQVLALPVPLRPATGIVVILDPLGVTSAHLLRPPLRDAGGHVRPQGPAVIAARDTASGRWEHFAWGVMPEIAEALDRRAGDLEMEVARRRDALAGPPESHPSSAV